MRAYLLARGNENYCVALWRRVLLSLANAPEHLPAFVAMQGLTEHLTPTGELDAVLEGMLGHILEGSGSNETEKGVLRQLLYDPSESGSVLFSAIVLIRCTAHFISPTCVHTARKRLGDTFVQGVNTALRDPESDVSTSSRLGAVATLLVAVSPAFEANEIEPVLPAVFGLAYLIPIQNGEEQDRDVVVSQAKSVWRAWVSRVPNSVFLSVREMAREMLVDISALPR